MNKRGFTLVELLAVIGLLGVIGLIAVPTVVNVIQQSREDALKQQQDLIVRSARNWANANAFSLPCGSEATCSETKTLTVAELVSSGYMEELNDDTYASAKVIISKNNNKYVYTFSES